MYLFLWLTGIASEQACMARGCCWKPVQANSLEPWCFYPNNYKSYQIETVQLMGDGQTSLVYRNIHKSTYPDDVEYVRVDVVYETEKRLRVKVRIWPVTTLTFWQLLNE